MDTFHSYVILTDRHTTNMILYEKIIKLKQITPL